LDGFTFGAPLPAWLTTGCEKTAMISSVATIARAGLHTMFAPVLGCIDSRISILHNKR
jgi:hypothetical protein